MPVIATTIIDNVGVSAGFVLSGAALIVIGVGAALALSRIRGRHRGRGGESHTPDPADSTLGFGPARLAG